MPSQASGGAPAAPLTGPPSAQLSFLLHMLILPFQLIQQRPPSHYPAHMPPLTLNLDCKSFHGGMPATGMNFWDECSPGHDDSQQVAQSGNGHAGASLDLISTATRTASLH